jgi:hypothetical protein
MNRRAFLEFAGASLAVPALGCGQATAIKGDASIEISLTGLFIMELWNSSPKKRAQLAFVDGTKTLGVAHAAMMMALLEDCVMPGDPDFPNSTESHRPAQIIRIGDSAYGMWSLTDYALWVDHLERDSTYPAEGDGDFDFPKRKGNIELGPQPRDADAGWAGREWFLEGADVLPMPVNQLQPSLISSRILLRNGQASGVAPKTYCERERTYYLADGEPKMAKRAVAAEIKVTHPANPDPSRRYTNFRVARLTGAARTPGSEEGQIIRLRSSPGHVTKLALVNVPLFAATEVGLEKMGHMTCKNDHFQAYFDLVGAGRRCLEPVEDSKCRPTRNPSEAGCVPLVILR